MIREKHRYVLVEPSRSIGLERYSFEKALKKELLSLIGQLEYNEVNPRVVIFNGDNFVLRCRLKGYKKLIVALAMVKRIDNFEVGFYTLKSSGTIKALLKSTKINENKEKGA